MQWKLRPPPSVEDFLPLWNGCQAAIKTPRPQKYNPAVPPERWQRKPLIQKSRSVTARCPQDQPPGQKLFSFSLITTN
jgi:hypothetical protein